MGKIPMDEAQQIRQELAQHRQDTDKVIDKLTSNIEKLTEAVSEIRMYQVELNAATQRIGTLESDLKALTTSVSDMTGKMAVANSFVSSANKLMWGVAAAIVLIMVKVVMDVGS